MESEEEAVEADESVHILLDAAAYLYAKSSICPSIVCPVRLVQLLMKNKIWLFWGVFFNGMILINNKEMSDSNELHLIYPVALFSLPCF